MNTRATVAPSAQEPPSPRPSKTPKYRLLLTFEGDQVVSSEVVRDDMHVLTLEGFRELLAKEGHAVVPKAVVTTLKIWVEFLGCPLDGGGHGDG